jgi:hypothetical protein
MCVLPGSEGAGVGGWGVNEEVNERVRVTPTYTTIQDCPRTPTTDIHNKHMPGVARIPQRTACPLRRLRWPEQTLTQSEPWYAQFDNIFNTIFF